MNGVVTGSTPLRSVGRTLGLALGVTLVACALVAIMNSAPALAQVRRAFAAPSLVAGLVALAAAIASFGFSGGMFFALLRNHGSLRFWQMVKLVTASGLLNYAPLRPGLVGRVAYQQLVCGITVRRSIWATLEAGVVSLATALWLAIAVTVVSRTDARAVGAIMVGAPALAGLALVGGRSSWWKVHAEAVFWRWLDVLAWTARYWAVFALIGVDLPWEGAAAAACVGLTASLVPLVGNGLGIREWAVALAGPWLGAWPEDLGLAADLVNRAIDLALIVPLGLVATVSVARELREASRVRRVTPQ